MFLSKQQKHQEENYMFPYHYLDLGVEIYQHIYSIEYLAYLEKIKDLLMPLKNKSVLDAGCGDGRFCFELKKDNVDVTGVDYSKKAVAFARIFNPGVEFYVQDLKNLKLTKKFDRIVLIETLEHIKPKEIPSVLKNINKYLNKNGKLVITVPSVTVPLAKKHYQHFSEQSLRETLSKMFRVTCVKGFGKKGLKRHIYENMKRLGILIWPFSFSLRFTKKYYWVLKKHYINNVAIGETRNCDRLIAVCEKK